MALLALAEAALRFRAWIKYGAISTTETDDMLALDPKVGLRVPQPGYELKGRASSVKINSLGFRGDEIDLIKPANTIRIACVGASTTFCTGVSNDAAAWPHQLQVALRRKHPDVSIEVINAGIPGYVASESLKNLSGRVLPLKPDLVIYYEAQNDMAYDTKMLARQLGVIKSDETYVSSSVRFLSRCSLLFDLIYKNLNIAVGGGEGGVKLDAIPADLPKRFIGEIQKMHEELQKHDIPFVLSTFIVKYRRDQERPVQIANADISFYYMPWMTIDRLLDCIEYYNEAISKYAHQQGIPVVEDRTSIPPDSRHFVDCVHLADQGCAKLADRFFVFLEENNILEKVIVRVKR